MLKYYEINGKTCFTDHMDFQCPPEADWKEIPEPRTAEELSWLFFREPGSWTIWDFYRSRSRASAWAS